LLARYHGLSFAASLVAVFGFILCSPSTSRAVGHWHFHNTVAWVPLLILLLRMSLDSSVLRRKLSLGIGAGLVYGIAILGGAPHFAVVVGFSIGCYTILYRILNLGFPPGDPGQPSGERPRKAAAAGSGGASRSRSATRRSRKREARAKPKHSLTRSWSRQRLWTTVKWNARPVAVDFAVLGIILVIAVLVSMPLLLPGMEFAQLSTRALEKDLLIPFDFEAVGKTDWNVFQRLIVYAGDGHYEKIQAAGACVAILAVLSAAYARKRNAFLYGLLFLILLDCSRTSPILFGRIVNWLAPYRMIAPARSMLIACLPLGLLAGMGLDAVVAPVRSRPIKLIRAFVILELGFCALFVLATKGHPHPSIDVTRWAIIVPGAACLVALLAGWLPAPRPWAVAIALLVFAETLVWTRHTLPHVVRPDTRFPGEMSMLEEQKQFWDDNHRGTQEEQPNINMYDLAPAINGYDPLHIKAVFRLLCHPLREKGYFPTDASADERAAAGLTGVSKEGSTMVARKVWSWEITATSYYGNLFLKRSFWLARQYVNGSLPPKNALFPATTTVFLHDPGELPLPEVPQDTVPRSAASERVARTSILNRGNQSYVLRVADDKTKAIGLAVAPVTLPAKHSSLHLIVTADCQAEIQPIFEAVGTGRTELGKRLRLVASEGEQHFEMPLPDFSEVQITLKPEFPEQEGKIWIHEMYALSDLEDEDLLIRIISRKSNSVELEVGELPDHRILTFVDAYYPGWHATVDGRPVRILRANDVFKAVVVPPGFHRVRFVFRPFRVYAGIAVSLTTVIASGFLLLWGRRRARRAA